MADLREDILTGSIPARAGETRPFQLYRQSRKVYPRTGGGNVGVFVEQGVGGGLSPHGRGKRCQCPATGLPRWSIPARAGETPYPGLGKVAGVVYPRTGGGNL